MADQHMADIFRLLDEHDEERKKLSKSWAKLAADIKIVKDNQESFSQEKFDINRQKTQLEGSYAKLIAGFEILTNDQRALEDGRRRHKINERADEESIRYQEELLDRRRARLVDERGRLIERRSNIDQARAWLESEREEFCEAQLDSYKQIEKQKIKIREDRVRLATDKQALNDHQEEYDRDNARLKSDQKKFEQAQLDFKKLIEKEKAKITAEKQTLKDDQQVCNQTRAQLSTTQKNFYQAQLDFNKLIQKERARAAVNRQAPEQDQDNLKLVKRQVAQCQVEMKDSMASSKCVQHYTAPSALDSPKTEEKIESIMLQVLRDGNLHGIVELGRALPNHMHHHPVFEQVLQTAFKAVMQRKMGMKERAVLGEFMIALGCLQLSTELKLLAEYVNG